MTVSIKLETSNSLAIEYKRLALTQNPSKLKVIESGELYSSNIILLLLNACIIEGVLRTWLTTEIKKDLKELATERKETGKTSPSKPELIAESYLVKVEHTGGWRNINDQYKEYMAVKLSGMSSYTAINHLFTLRNVVGHGTSIVIPKHHAEAPGSDYTDSWQKKFEDVRKYLTSNLNASNVLDSLSKSEISKHFWEQSRIFLDEVSGKFGNKVIRSSSAYKSFDGYSFGFRD